MPHAERCGTYLIISAYRRFQQGKHLAHFSHLRVIPCGMGGSNLPDHPEPFALLRRTDQNPVLWVDVVAFTLYGHFDGVATHDGACLADRNAS